MRLRWWRRGATSNGGNVTAGMLVRQRLSEDALAQARAALAAAHERRPAVSAAAEALRLVHDPFADAIAEAFRRSP